MESVYQRLGLNLKPSNVVDKLLSVNLVLHAVEVFDFLVELHKVGLAGNHTIENLLVHEVEFIHSILHVVLVVFLVFTNVESVLLLVVDFSHVISVFKEGLEGLVNVLFPEEVPLSVLVKESASLGSDFVHVVLDVLEGAEKNELIFNFNKVIASTSILVIEAGNLNSNGDEVADDLVDDVPDARIAVIAIEGGDEVQIGAGAFNQVNLDLENRCPHVANVSLKVKLVAHVLHGGVNGEGDTFNHEAVAEVNVAEPVGALFVRLDVIKSVSEELVDFFTLLADVILAGLDRSAVEVDDGVRLHGLSAFKEGLLPGSHDVADLGDVVLHFLGKLVNLGDNFHAVSNEGVNAFRTPLEGLYSRLEGLDRKSVV